MKNADTLYGMFIYKKDGSLYNLQKIDVSNAGIKVNNMKALHNYILPLAGDYFDVLINFNAKQIDLDVSREEIKDTSKFIKYLSKEKRNLTKEFAVLKENLLNLYIDKEFKRIPYFILSELHNVFSYQRVILVFEQDKFMIKYNGDDKYKLPDYYNTFIKIAAFFINVKTADCCLEKINNCESQCVGDFEGVFHILFLLWRIIKQHMDMTINIDRVMAMEKAVSRDRAMVRAMSMDIDIAVERLMSMVKTMGRDSVSVIRKMDMGMVGDRLMTMVSDMVINEESIHNILAWLYCLCLFYYKSKETDITFNLLYADILLPFFASYLLTLEQVENGFEFKIAEYINKLDKNQNN